MYVCVCWGNFECFGCVFRTLCCRSWHWDKGSVFWNGELKDLSCPWITVGVWSIHNSVAEWIIKSSDARNTFLVECDVNTFSKQILALQLNWGRIKRFRSMIFLVNQHIWSFDSPIQVQVFLLIAWFSCLSHCFYFFIMIVFGICKN